MCSSKSLISKAAQRGPEHTHHHDAPLAERLGTTTVHGATLVPGFKRQISGWSSELIQSPYFSTEPQDCVSGYLPGLLHRYPKRLYTQCPNTSVLSTCLSAISTQLTQRQRLSKSLSGNDHSLKFLFSANMVPSDNKWVKNTHEPVSLANISLYFESWLGISSQCKFREHSHSRKLWDQTEKMPGDEVTPQPLPCSRC